MTKSNYNCSNCLKLAENKKKQKAKFDFPCVKGKCPNHDAMTIGIGELVGAWSLIWRPEHVPKEILLNLCDLQCTDTISLFLEMDAEAALIRSEQLESNSK